MKRLCLSAICIGILFIAPLQPTPQSFRDPFLKRSIQTLTLSSLTQAPIRNASATDLPLLTGIIWDDQKNIAIMHYQGVSSIVQEGTRLGTGIIQNIFQKNLVFMYRKKRLHINIGERIPL